MIVAYLIGSIPFSFLVARAFGVADVRRVGSGNVGATNVLRNAGKPAGAAALAARRGEGRPGRGGGAAARPRASGAARRRGGRAVLGHVYPVWLGCGAARASQPASERSLVLEPTAALIALPIFGLTVATTHSLRSVRCWGLRASPRLTLFFRGLDAVAIAAVAIAALIVLRHRSNLRRILDGSERRLDWGEGQAGEARGSGRRILGHGARSPRWRAPATRCGCGSARPGSRRAVNDRRESPRTCPGSSCPRGCARRPNLGEAVADAEAVIVAVPSEYLPRDLPAGGAACCRRAPCSCPPRRDWRRTACNA